MYELRNCLWSFCPTMKTLLPPHILHICPHIQFLTFTNLEVLCMLYQEWSSFADSCNMSFLTLPCHWPTTWSKRTTFFQSEKLFICCNSSLLGLLSKNRQLCPNNMRFCDTSSVLYILKKTHKNVSLKTGSQMRGKKH